MFYAGLSLGVTTAFNAGLYYANSKVFDVGDPKAAAIYSATNTVVKSAVSRAVYIATCVCLASLLATHFKTDATNPLTANAGLIKAAYVIATTSGIVTGILSGKKICQSSGNPITAKQIVGLALIYGVETLMLSTENACI